MTNRDDMAFFGCIGIVMFWFIGAVTATIFRGWVLCTLYGWFVQETFSLPELSIPIAIGISVIVSMLTHENQSEKKEDESLDKYTVGLIVKALALPAVSLAIGWVVKSFI